MRSKPGLLLCPGEGKQTLTICGAFSELTTDLISAASVQELSQHRHLEVSEQIQNMLESWWPPDREERQSFIPVESPALLSKGVNHIPPLSNKVNFQILSSSSVCHFTKTKCLNNIKNSS